MPKVETFNREVVLENVIKLFHEKGYNATSMQDLVDATGLNRSSIYNSFGSKKELYQESLKMYRAQGIKSIQKVLIHVNNPKESIRKIFASDPFTRAHGCFLSNCTSEMANQDIEIRSFLTNNLEYMQELFEELVSKGQSEGSINNHKTAKEYAIYLFTTLQGIRVTGILLDEQQHFESIVSTILSVLD